jgi:hypothetical protein
LFQYGQYFQTAKKSPLTAPDLSIAPVSLLQHFESLENFSRSLADQNVHAPPGEPRNVSLPLLI